MTEEEAKTKWCPFVQVALAQSHGSYGHSGTKATNRPQAFGIRTDEGPCCIASACMAWRWTLSPLSLAKFEGTDAAFDEGTRPSGYCGLAGQP